MPNKNLQAQPISTSTDVSTLWTQREVTLLALVCLLSGLVMGYLFHGTSPAAAPGTVAAAGGTSGPGSATHPPVPTAQDLAPIAGPLLTTLKADPKNAATLIQLGNLYYDHQVFPEAITYYTRALEAEPKNTDVRTDLGTAYWYSGFPEKAIAEYEKALAINPRHVNATFNLGVVRLEGLKDSAGAARAFEKLLTMNPSPEQRAKAQELLARARGAKL